MFDPAWYRWPYHIIDVHRLDDVRKWCNMQGLKFQKDYNWNAYIEDAHMAGIEVHFSNKEDLMAFKLSYETIQN
jgi:hypothetical protein